MFKLHFLSIALFALVIFFGCKKEKEEVNPIIPNEPMLMNFNNAKLAVSFNGLKSIHNTVLTKQTPFEYIIGLKSAKLIGYNGSNNFVFFNEPSVNNSLVFDFINDTVRHDLNEDSIPDGYYSHIEVELYFLQMKLDIYSINRGVEARNIRIYFSEDGVHLPGDVTQIDDNGVELGWLFGNGTYPDFDPVSPRVAAYSANGDGVNWLPFADKSAEFFGPFGSLSFWQNNPTQPFVDNFDFNFQSSNGQDLVIDFYVVDCWQFEDKTNDGYFGADDLFYDSNPTAWHMEYPEIIVRLE